MYIQNLLITISLLSPLFLHGARKSNLSKQIITESVAEKTTETIVVEPARFKIKEFTIAGKIPNFSKKQLEEHLTLYKGYVNKFNEIELKLTNGLEKGDTPNKTYSRFRALKLSETYAENGSILHELYFENLSSSQQTVGKKMEKLIKRNWGTLEGFKKDLFNCALASRGWVMTAYSFYDKRVRNYVLEEHNQTVPVMTMPLLVLDVYEHAYMIDFGINRSAYLDIFWNQINWDVVEQRIAKWVP